MTSKNSIVLRPGYALDPISIEDMLEIIDFALIKIYIKLDDYDKLSAFLQQKDGKQNKIYCKSLYKDLLPSDKDIDKMRKTRYSNHENIRCLRLVHNLLY